MHKKCTLKLSYNYNLYHSNEAPSSYMYCAQYSSCLLLKAANVPSKSETITPHSNEDTVPKLKEKQKESHSRDDNKEPIPVAHGNEKSHTVTKHSLPNITVTKCYKTITGYKKPFYIQIIGNEVFLTKHGTKYIHVSDVKTGS